MLNRGYELVGGERRIREKRPVPEPSSMMLSPSGRDLALVDREEWMYCRDSAGYDGRALQVDKAKDQHGFSHMIVHLRA